MPQSLVKNYIHLVYSTKNRTKMIADDFQSRLWSYQSMIFQNCESPAITIGGTSDHIHALFVLSKNQRLCDVVEEVKKSSSKFIKVETQQPQFFWQSGYAAFSVSQSSIEQVRRYINHQPEHHRETTFQDELRVLLERHQTEYDERYLWD